MNCKITLCLSGGGFRATIFHLGVIDYLVQAGQLEDVTSVYGVSGGAITAAHLAHSWPAYSDPGLYSSAALSLLERCHEGILDQVVWSSLAWQKNRSLQMAEELDSLFRATIPASARPTYLICSSLTDTSQFAIELVSRELYHLLPGRHEVRPRGRVRDNLKTSIAVAMSACFPLVFEPITLDSRLTGLDVKALGREHTVADGGVVDNLGIAMAHIIERQIGEGHLFLVSDAGRIFDDMDSQEAERATMLSPMRTIDYLLNQNAASVLAQVGPLVAERKAGLAVIRLQDARSAATKLKIDSGLVQAAMDLRTSFDSFSVGEIVTTYRMGIILADSALGSMSSRGRTIKFEGLICENHLNNSPLNIPWSEVIIESGSGAFGEAVEKILRKPGLAILSAGVVVLCAAAAVGIVVRAILHF